MGLCETPSHKETRVDSHQTPAHKQAQGSKEEGT